MRDPATAVVDPTPAPTFKSRLTKMMRQRSTLMIGGVVFIVTFFLALLLLGGGSVSTENAYVQAARSPVSASISGRIVEMRVHDNQIVEPGQTLFVLDSDNPQAELHEAEAALAAARAQAAELKATYASNVASYRSSQAALSYAVKQSTRERALQKEGLSARQQVEGSDYNTIEARRNVEKAQQMVAASLAAVGGTANRPIDEYPVVREAAARLDSARVTVANTNIKALTGGIVTRVDQVQVGSYVNVGQPLFWLVSTSPWIEANFKEDQLENIRVGQLAKVKIDAYPGVKFQARVASFSPGTGAVFSAIPAQNATGNWVKVVQRLPVRLNLINPPLDLAISAGLSAKVTVNTKSPGVALRGRE